MAEGGVSGKAVAVTLAGVILIWSALKNKRISAVTRDIISGNDPTTDPQAAQNPVGAIDPNLAGLLTPPSTGGGTVSGYQPGSIGNLLNPNPPAATGTAKANQAIAQPLASALGWTGQQWNDLVALWNQESGWNNNARNSSSGAYGIPQALPATKMSALAQAGDAKAQILWGLSYIKGRYGNPANAWAHEVQYGWY